MADAIWNERYILSNASPDAMYTSGLEYDANDKISGYAGSAFAGGSEIPTAVSGYWQSASDTVCANSGAWGGSALPVSAGPGVKIGLQNDILVFSTDETVLWSGTCKANSSVNLSESYKNFEKIKIYGYHSAGATMSKEARTNDITATTTKEITLESWVSWGNAANYKFAISMPCDFTSDTVLATKAGRFVGNWDNSWQASTGTDPNNTTLTEVVGINRIAGN